MKARKQGTVLEGDRGRFSVSFFSPLSPTLSPSQGPADAGPFLYEKTQGKTRELEAIDSKKRHNRQRTRTMGKGDTEPSPVSLSPCLPVSMSPCLHVDYGDINLEEYLQKNDKNGKKKK